MKKTDETNNPWPFRLWIGAIVLLALILSVIVTAWAVRHVIVKGSTRFTEDQADFVLGIASFPGQTKLAVLEVINMLKDEPARYLVDKSVAEKPQWSRRFPAPEDDGYLLFSGLDKGEKEPSIALMRIRDGEVLARWRPDWDEVLKHTTVTKYVDVTKANVLAVHPLLLPDGDVIFNTWASMARVGVCDAKPKWVLDEVMHHSNELDNDGNIWVPSVSKEGEGFADNTWLAEQARDDALALVSPEGKLLQKISFAKVMREHGLESLLLGTKGLRMHEDPLHMNQISVARNTTEHWQRGDLLISNRNISTLFLYRPSTGKIIWHQTGPWMNQHSAAFVGDHQISVFDNNVFVGKEFASHSFITPEDVNRVMIYDFKTDQVTQPYAKLLQAARPMSITEGRAQILGDGGLFLEETNFGRHLRFTKDQLLWSRVNDWDDTRVGMVSWSRYLTPEEVEQPLKAISNLNCTGQKRG